MSNFRKYEVRTLADWLEVATRRLAEPAKTRVQAEIEAHYAEAVRDHRESGLSPSAAEAKALAELGGAKAAAKRLRNRHLTTWEDSLVKNSLNEARSTYSLLLGYALFAGVYYLIAQHLHWWALRGQIPWLAINFLVLVALPTAAFILARFGDPKRKARLLLLLMAARGALPLMYLIFLLMLFAYAFFLSLLWCYVLGLLLLIFAVYLHLHVWKKLQRIGDFPNKFPPAGAAQG